MFFSKNSRKFANSSSPALGKKNYQPIVMTVHSHCIWRSLTAMLTREGLQLKTHFFLNTLYLKQINHNSAGVIVLKDYMWAANRTVNRWSANPILQIFCKCVELSSHPATWVSRWTGRPPRGCRYWRWSWCWRWCTQSSAARCSAPRRTCSRYKNKPMLKKNLYMILLAKNQWHYSNYWLAVDTLS